MTPQVYAANADARAILELLHALFLKQIHGTAVEPTLKTLETTGLDLQRYKNAVARLQVKSLVEDAGSGRIKISAIGLKVYEDRDALDRELPIMQAASVAAPAAPDVFALHADARTMLAALHGAALSHPGASVWFEPKEATLAELGLDVSRFHGAGERLVMKGLGKRISLSGWYGITDRGLQVSEDLSALERELPIATAARPVPAVEVTEALREIRSASLDFMVDAELRRIVKRDLDELDAAIIAGLHKCSAILAGSVAEAILIDILERNRTVAQTYVKQPFPERTSLGDLVKIAIGEDLLEAVAGGLVDHLKDFRDLVHPDGERRTKPKVDATTAGALVSLLRLVVRDLSEAAAGDKLKAYLAK